MLYFVLHLTVIQLSPNRIAANFLTCFTLCHVSHAAMQLLTFLACLFMGNDPLSCKCMGLMVYADHNNTPSSTQSSLGLNWKLGNWDRRTEASSQVESSGVKFSHLTNTWSTFCRFLTTSLVASILSGAILTWPSSVVRGRSWVGLTPLVEGLSKDTWKTGWMVEPSGNSNL